MKIVFATRNEGKVKEIKNMFEGTGIDLASLNNYENIPEIIEDGNTFLENALKKAKIIADITGETVLADDSGLQVDILGGEPGIRSARYAGEGATDEENNKKLLTKLRNIPLEKRHASFCCVLVLYKTDGSYHSFDGQWQGIIIDDARGTNGFGYDPIFFVPDLKKTAAELPSAIKNKISHRGQAFAKLKQYLPRLMEKQIGA
ncbi:MAG TPA: XTP/dITP diphosphatase [Smithellaceae bacterium]|nr:XTP/dITP diphosphatase [Smithellaceae bacterium]HRS89604.1 XTP/dITP diphosphatase [Smithellaceae bacterium]HRV25840.1 XTP/dITP diphosphatase [Smithellaceae bacterium]